MAEKVSFWQAVAVGLGAIIGAGIFVLSGSAISLAGSWSLLAFLFVGGMSLLTATVLGELATILPHEKGSTYSYAYKAFGRELGLVTGVMVFFSFSTSIAAVADGFGAYLASALRAPSFSLTFAIALTLVLTLVNLAGIQKAARADLFLVLIKLSVLSLFITFSLYVGFARFHPSNFASTPRQSSILPFFSSTIAIFFAYTGFQVITSFTDEVKGGPEVAARAVVVSVLISVLFYVLVALSLILLVPVSKFGVNADPLSFALAYAGAPVWLHEVVDFGGMVATTSATLAMILASGRTLYQLALDMELPKFLLKYDSQRDVPSTAVVISVAIAIATFFAGNVYVIASISNFGLVFSFIASNLALVHFRRRGVVGTYRTPLYPYSIVASTVMLISLLAGFPREALTINVAVVVVMFVAAYLIKDFRELNVLRKFEEKRSAGAGKRR